MATSAHSHRHKRTSLLRSGRDADRHSSVVTERRDSHTEDAQVIDLGILGVGADRLLALDASRWPTALPHRGGHQPSVPRGRARSVHRACINNIITFLPRAAAVVTSASQA